MAIDTNFKRVSAPASLLYWSILGGMTLLALLASAFRIVLAPGFELYIGPVFYLLAYRAGGLRFAVPVAILVMLPSVWWWGHFLSVGLAIGHVIFVHVFRHQLRSLAVATTVYFVTVSAVVGSLFLHYKYAASTDIIALVTIRKLLNDVVIAAFVDLMYATIKFDVLAGKLSRRKMIRLGELLPAIVTLVVSTSALLLFATNVIGFSRDVDRYASDMRARIELHIRGDMDSRRILGGHQQQEQTTPFYVVAAGADALMRRPAILNTLRCNHLDGGGEIQGANDRNTFVYWLGACSTGSIEVAGRDYVYIYPVRQITGKVYTGILNQMIGPGILLALSIALDLFFKRAMARSLRAWDDVVEGFGQPALPAPSGLIFKEFMRPMTAVVDANNRLASLEDERKQLASAFVELKLEMNLRLAADIHFDDATGLLRFHELELDCPSHDDVIEIYANDRVAFATVANSREAFVEFRTADGANHDWFLLSARDLTAPGQWRSGWIVRLRQSKLSQHRMLQQARLVELGGMASAISHELKQPLFTISLSSENGRLLIDQDTPEAIARARSKFDRVSEQVNRAKDIISRISRYSRIEDDDPAPVDLGELINTAVTFMRSLLIEQNVNLQIDLPQTPICISVPRVGLEQVFVNGIQNAIDAIASYREDQPAGMIGEITVSAAMYDGDLRIQIVDNGTGLELEQPETAFDAFFTTKSADKGTGLGLYICKQIIMEIGGKITLSTRCPVNRGAIMTIDLPGSMIVGDTRTLTQRQVDA